MAKFLPGATIADASGSVGGCVFSKNHYGGYIRRRVAPSHPYTEYTATVKAVFTAVTRNWSSLTDAQRLAWKTYSQNNPITDRLGQRQILQANDVYVKLSSRLILAGDLAVSTPPTTAAPSPVAGLAATFDIGAGDFEITWTSGAVGANNRLWVWAALVDSASIINVKNRLRSLVISAKNQASPLNLETEMADRFGTLQVGQKVIVLASIFDSTTGLISGPNRVEGLVTST